jgi:hypothetical protein
MFMLSLSTLVAVAFVAAGNAATISNSKIEVTVTEAGLTAVGTVMVKNDSFALVISAAGLTTLTPATCSHPKVASVGDTNITLTYMDCAGGFTVVARYWLPSNVSNYISKDLTVHSGNLG